MIIDFHTHVGTVVNKSVDDLLHSMDKSRIDKSVIIAGDVVGLTNEELIKILDKHPDRFYGVLAVYPQNILYMVDGKNLSGKSQSDLIYLNNDLSHPAVLGMKFYTGYHHYFPNDDRIKHYFHLLKNKNKIAIFHCGDTYSVNKMAKLRYAQPIYVDDLATDFPEVKIVIAHMGYPSHRDTAEVIYKNSNVYTDVSGFVYERFTDRDYKKFKKILEDINFIIDDNLFAERLLFGTDYPISNQESYIDALEDLKIEREFLKLEFRQFFRNITNNTEKFVNSVLERKE